MFNVGHGIFQKVMAKVMESQGILTGQKCTNPALFDTEKCQRRSEFEIVYSVTTNTVNLSRLDFQLFRVSGCHLTPISEEH